MSLYKKQVAQDDDRLGIFLLALKGLRPAIRQREYLEEWWKLVIKPVLDGIGHTRVAIKHASALLLDILDFDADTTDGETKKVEARISSYFGGQLLDCYIKRNYVTIIQDETLSSEDQFITAQISEVLLGYGRRKPKVRIV